MSEVDDNLGGRIGERTQRVTGIDFRTQLQVRGLADRGAHRHSDLARRTQRPDSHGLSVVAGFCQTPAILFEHEFDFR